MSRTLNASVNTSIENSEQGYALRPAYLVLFSVGATTLALTTGDNYDFQSLTFTSADLKISRLSFDSTANQNVRIEASDTDDVIKSLLLNNSATDEIELFVYKRLQDVSATAAVITVFDGIVDGASFTRSGVTVTGIAQDKRVYMPRQFVSVREGFNHITKPGTYQIGGQTFTTRPRT